MASSAPSSDGGGDDKPPEVAPVNLASPDPTADPQRNGESPAPVPSSGDDDMSRMGMLASSGDDDVSTMGMTATSGDDDTATMGTAERGTKRPLPSRPTPPCPRCARRKRILRGIDSGPPQSDDELSALPPSAPDSPVPGTGMELPDPRAPATNGSPSAAEWCAGCEFRKKIHRNRRLQRDSQVPASPGKKRPLSVEEERGYRECDVGKKLRRHRWDGLYHKWALGLPDFGDVLGKTMLDVQNKLAPRQGAQKHVFGPTAGERDLLDMMMLDVQKKPRQRAQKPGFGAEARERDLLDMMMLDVQKKLAPLQRARKPGFGPAAGERDLLDMMMLDVQNKLEPLQGAQKPGFGAAAGGNVLLHKALHEDDARLALQQEAQKPSRSAAARVDVLQQKLAQMIKVVTKVLREGNVLRVSAKLIRVLCPDVGFRAAAGGLDGSDWRLLEKAIDNLVNQTGEGIQDIVKTVIPNFFSKEILYDLIMACVGQYPKLLQDDKGKLPQEKHKLYQKQLDLMVNLTMVYDDDPNNFSKIMKLICKIGECGPLPREVIDGISPGFDPSTMEQLYTGMVELLHSVDRASPVDANPTSK